MTDSLELPPRPTAAARQARRRALLASVEEDSAREWLRRYLYEEPASVHLARDLFERAREDLSGRWAARDGLVVPRRISFYRAADRVLGPRRHTERGAVYTIPERRP